MRPNDMPRPFAPDHSDGDDVAQRLRSRMDADELELEAADEIERLRACLKYEEHRFATQSTHSEGCHSFGPRHYECALREIERLRAEVAEAKRDARILRINAKAREDAVASIGCELVQDGDVYVLVNTRAEKAERELAALRERFEKAPVAEPDGGWIDVAVPDSWNGHRVRLVRED